MTLLLSLYFSSSDGGSFMELSSLFVMLSSKHYLVEIKGEKMSKD